MEPMEKKKTRNPLDSASLTLGEKERNSWTLAALFAMDEKCLKKALRLVVFRSLDVNGINQST